MRITLIMLAALLPAACMSDGPTVDDNPAAPMGEAITEPTDGFENETDIDE